MVRIGFLDFIFLAGEISYQKHVHVRYIKGRKQGAIEINLEDKSKNLKIMTKKRNKKIRLGSAKLNCFEINRTKSH